MKLKFESRGTGIRLAAAVMVAVAVMVGGSLVGAARQTTNQVSPPAPDWSGTYLIVLKRESPDGPREDKGMIVIKQDGATLAVTAGPAADQQWPAGRLVRLGDDLSFEVVPPDDTPTAFRFELSIKGPQVSGKAAMTRNGEVRTAVVEGTRQ